MKALWQHVLYISTYELRAFYPGCDPSAAFAVLIAEGHMRLVHSDDAMVGYGNAEYISSQVVQHDRLTLTVVQAVNNPVFGPCSRVDMTTEILMAPSQPRGELAADQLGQRFDRNQIFILAGYPPAILIDATTGDQHVHMRMIRQIARPGMQNSQYPDPAAQVPGIVCKLYQRLGCGPHQKRIHPLLIAAKDMAQRARDRHCDMKVVTGQQFSGALFEPLLYLVSVAGRAVPVAAGVIDIYLFTAMLTLVNVSAFGLCSALLDVVYGLGV